MSHEAKVDLVTKSHGGERFTMILVVQGPWNENAIQDELRVVQDRLYDYVDIAVHGHLSKLFPESYGKDIVIRVDSYCAPEQPLADFLDRFEAHIQSSEEIQAAIRSNGNVRTLVFERHHDRNPPVV